MFVRFDSEVSLSHGAYKSIVTRYANPRIANDWCGELPAFYYSEGVRKRAGSLAIVTATADEFSGVWTLETDNDRDSSAKSYIKLVEAAGISEADVHPFSYDQHIVGGTRIEEGFFAVASVFRADTTKRKSPKLSKEKHEKIGETYRGLFTGGTPAIGDFDYAQFMRFAKLVGKKRVIKVSHF